MSGEVMLLLRLALAGVLYAFLGWAIWVLWRGLRRNAILPKRKSEISDGSIDPIMLSMPGVDEIYSFSVPKVVVGRDPACELQVQDRYLEFIGPGEQSRIIDKGIGIPACGNESISHS